MVDNTRCLRCDGKMNYVGVEQIQLGQTGLLMGMWNNIIAGSMEVKIYICSVCKKIEFYSTNDTDTDVNDNSGSLPQKTCPACGVNHDIDYPKCPSCKHRYND